MTTIEYLSLSKPRRFLVKFLSFFVAIGRGIVSFFKGIPHFFTKLGNGILRPFAVLVDAMKRGNWQTRLNFLVMGFAQLLNKQVAKGVLFLIFELAFIFFMISVGVPNLSRLGTLGMVNHVKYYDTDGVELTNVYDNSFNILLFSVATIVIIVIAIALWYLSIRDAKALQDYKAIGRIHSNKEFLADIADKNYHIVLLSVPMVGLVVFTIIPIIFMILVGFTNYTSDRNFGAYLFDWVGFENYASIFSNGDFASSAVLSTFLKVLLWTLIWAFFATFSNYFLGMVVAIIINVKGIKLKKVWRTILITTIAVPQLVSLMLMNRMLQDMGFINEFLKQIGLISEPIRFLGEGADPTVAKVVIIVVNTWIGIPYTMLTCTGILMNIPDDLYESARIDGASPFKMYMKITLPYMLFVTGPYLISTFVGNINNFNVIYLLSGGAPTFNIANKPNLLQGVGQTDLLITWMYKLTTSNNPQYFNMASVFGVLIFIIVATFSLITYSRSSAVKNEEDFQ